MSSTWRRATVWCGEVERPKSTTVGEEREEDAYHMVEGAADSKVRMVSVQVRRAVGREAEGVAPVRGSHSMGSR